MIEQLPDDIAAAVDPVLTVLPIELAMTDLVVTAGRPELIETVEAAAKSPALAQRPALVAGLWLYIDELDRSHHVSQGIHDPTGSYWHGVMHRREGDFSNSRYWFDRVGQHPAMQSIGSDYDAYEFIDQVERAFRHDEHAPQLVDLQRREWAGLFAWCAAH